MEKNVGSFDRNIRIILGITLLIAGLFIQAGAGLKTAFFAVAAIALITAFTGF